MNINWECHFCTYSNGDHPICEMCSTVRPQPPPPPNEIVRRLVRSPRATWTCRHTWCAAVNKEKYRNCGGCGAFDRYRVLVYPAILIPNIERGVNDRGLQDFRCASAGNDDDNNAEMIAETNGGVGNDDEGGIGGDDDSGSGVGGVVVGGGEKHNTSIDIVQIDDRDTKKVARSIDDDIKNISGELASTLVIEAPFDCDESSIEEEDDSSDIKKGGVGEGGEFIDANETELDEEIVRQVQDELPFDFDLLKRTIEYNEAIFDLGVVGADSGCHPAAINEAEEQIFIESDRSRTEVHDNDTEQENVSGCGVEGVISCECCLCLCFVFKCCTIILYIHYSYHR